MKATDFLDEWNRAHTSSPSYQDILDWAERKQAEEMKELNNEWRVTLTLQKQAIIKKAHEWLKEHICEYIAIGNTDYGKPYDIHVCEEELFDNFSKAMDE